LRESYPDARPGRIVEEFAAAVGEGIERSDVSHLGISIREAAWWYSLWAESLAGGMV